MSIGIPFRGLRRGMGQSPFFPPRGGEDGLSGVGGDFKATSVIATTAMAAARSHQCSHRQQIVGLLCMPPLALALARGSCEGSLWSHAAGLSPFARPSCPSPLFQRRFPFLAAREHIAAFTNFLSWGFPKTAPPPSKEPRVHSGALLPFGPGLPSSELVPPLPFLPASTVYAARPPQVYCALHPVLGFATFQVIRRRSRHWPVSLVSPGILPNGAVHTLQSLPLAVSRAASPRPLPSHPSTGSQGFAPTSSPLPSDPIAETDGPLLSWASFPFRALPAETALSASAPSDPSPDQIAPSRQEPSRPPTAGTGPEGPPCCCSEELLLLSTGPPVDFAQTTS